LEHPKNKKALSMFKTFIERPDQQFDDLRAEIVAQLPEVLKAKQPKPQRVISSIQTLDRMLRDYNPLFIDQLNLSENKRSILRTEFLNSLESLLAAIKDLRAKF
jgi:hypothetical protein